MSRLDLVREYVERRYWQTDGAPRGVDAGEVARELSIWRNDASADLNKLCNQGILKKAGKKPVLYYPAAVEMGSTQAGQDRNESAQRTEIMGFNSNYLGNIQSKTAFRGVVGSSGSLKTQIQMAKAAVLYPPHGLHTLIIGETGVGKSLFAEEMWRFAVENRVFQSDTKSIPFIVFNCAEYADNPQLLLSQLFGHVKGAFTGANESKVGLVEKADGGILFLDEIHRLPPTGQELFFMLIDKGQYRRLGDTVDRTANLMIIGATTEEPSSILLQTFKRRIPVLIQLPTLTERPISERISLIGLFLSQEANRLNSPIWISGQAFQIMVSQNCKTNIGDLKNALQLCCAKSYLSYLSSSGEGKRAQYGKNPQQPFLSIDINDLPQRTYPNIQELDIPQDLLTQHVFSEGMTAFPGMSVSFESLSNDYELSIDLYGFVEKQIEAYRHLHMTQGEIERMVTSDLDKYYSNAVKAMHNSADSDDSILHSIISQKIWFVANQILSMASKYLGRKYSKSIQAALALHLQQLKERENGGHKVFNPDLLYMKSKYETEISFVRSILPQISGLINMTIPEEEIGFLSMFLSQPIEENNPSRVGLIVVAHGRSTATSMADFVNQLLSTDHIVAINAPINKSMLNVYNELCKAVVDCDQGKGVLLLVDMGSFASIQEDICAKTGVACKVIPNVSSALVLEAGKVVISSNDSLDDIAAKVTDRYKEYVNSIMPNFDLQANKMQQDNGYSEESATGPGVIITVCATGIGSAIKLGEILRDKVPAAKDIEVIPMGAMDDIKGVAKIYGKRLRMVVGNFNPNLEEIPYFSAEAILMGEGLQRIEALLRNMTVSIQSGRPVEYSREDAIRLIERQIKRFAPSFSTEMVMKHTIVIADRIECEMMREKLPMDHVVRIILHSASMLERLNIGDIVPMPPWGKTEINRNKKLFTMLKLIMNEEFAAFGFAVPDSELAYMLTNLIKDPTCKIRREDMRA